MLPGDDQCGVCEGWLPLDFSDLLNSGVARRVRRSKAEVWSGLLSRLQTTGIYPVRLDGAPVQRMKLTEAQAGGLACLGCNQACGIGKAAFRPAGHVVGGSQVFRCIACIEGGER
ncbi:hypothetical protein N8J89_09050 [Crossiella sp. CA-258035]|uniref:hypothetical protein n=1 Tax=Crossiella sp. CA-258035 TaxID=2981138 RepID=UPI0024BD49A4|nr:hypothetical protein [Crossiella sp. CA-258035]WHT21187.1 hypothetical protein N8J89_09050 [Crossiella sp. CA-258035]